ETVGFVQPSESNIIHAHVFAEGWIEKLLVKDTDQPIKKGQLLFQLYSPTLVNAEQEFIIALNSKNSDLIDSSHKRLLAFHISEKQIQRLKQTHMVDHLIDVFAEQGGILSTLNVREGMHVTPSSEIMSITNLSNIWVIAEVFANQANWVKQGQNAEVQVDGFPGKTWNGTIDYIYPEIDPVSRTLKVRLQFNNPEIVLKPNTFVHVTLLVDQKNNALSIPTEALIQTGQNNNRVIVSLGNGQFEPRNVVVGIQSGNRIEILSGLSKGEKVVISGEFLIDSEANLQATLQRLNAKSKPTMNEGK
ncbi:MAG: efflux RND transporter periplasmic adaptor subunit, partial [Gammaproteobacteria bacterium]